MNDFGTIWNHRIFLTSSGKPIAHHTLVSQLLDAILLPKQMAVCKCQAQVSHPTLEKQFDHLQMDFIELTPGEGKKFCLVIVDMFSKWVDIFPTAKQDANAVAKVLIRGIIPRWGIPSKISSDNGTPFVSATLKQVGEYFGIEIRQHCAYHPASGGGIEGENGTLKNKLTKYCEETGLSGTKALPVQTSSRTI